MRCTLQLRSGSVNFLSCDLFIDLQYVFMFLYSKTPFLFIYCLFLSKRNIEMKNKRCPEFSVYLFLLILTYNYPCVIYYYIKHSSHFNSSPLTLTFLHLLKQYHNLNSIIVKIFLLLKPDNKH